MGAGAFSREGWTFTVDTRGDAVELGDFVEVHDEALEARLLGSGRLPELHGAAVASWLLARLAYLAQGSLGFEPGAIEVCDQPVYIVDLRVSRAEAPQAKLQIQAGAIGVGVLGVRSAEVEAEALLAVLERALLESPGALAPIRVEVETPDGVRRGYGLEGARLL